MGDRVLGSEVWTGHPEAWLATVDQWGALRWYGDGVLVNPSTDYAPMQLLRNPNRPEQWRTLDQSVFGPGLESILPKCRGAYANDIGVLCFTDSDGGIWEAHDMGMFLPGSEIRREESISGNEDRVEPIGTGGGIASSIDDLIEAMEDEDSTAEGRLARAKRRVDARYRVDPPKARCATCLMVERGYGDPVCTKHRFTVNPERGVCDLYQGEIGVER